jgi:HSP20 family molecular chaperone IbpA
MVFSAALPSCCTDAADGGSDNGAENTENRKYLKRRLKMKAIERQKYLVPADKYDQESVKAVFKNGILKVEIPPKEEPELNDGIKIEIMKEGN